MKFGRGWEGKGEREVSRLWNSFKDLAKSYYYLEKKNHWVNAICNSFHYSHYYNPPKKPSSTQYHHTHLLPPHPHTPPIIPTPITLTLSKRKIRKTNAFNDKIPTSLHPFQAIKSQTQSTKNNNLRQFTCSVRSSSTGPCKCSLNRGKKPSPRNVHFTKKDEKAWHAPKCGQEYKTRKHSKTPTAIRNHCCKHTM